MLKVFNRACSLQARCNHDTKYKVTSTVSHVRSVLISHGNSILPSENSLLVDGLSPKEKLDPCTSLSIIFGCLSAKRHMCEQAQILNDFSAEQIAPTFVAFKERLVQL